MYSCPQSVGFKLKQEAKYFKGKILTATDITVGSGRIKLEDPDSTLIGLTRDEYDKAQTEIIKLKLF